MSEILTKKQSAVLECIKGFIEVNGYGPTVREICDSLHLSSPSTVHAHLKTLEDKGYIQKCDNKSRSITLTPKSISLSTEVKEDFFSLSSMKAFSHTINIPVVGQVAAGVPILAEENITDTLTLPVDIVSDSASFILNVKGESMIEAGINDGDYIVVKEQPTAQNGDIVVALIEDEATVKRFYKEIDHIRLQPENASMNPIIVQDCRIAGKVVAVFRRL